MAPPVAPQPLSVVVLGGGTVGAQVVRMLTEGADDLAARVGARLVVTGVGVRDAGRERPGIPAGLLTDDLPALLDTDPDIVVELMGGIEPARELVLRALKGGASVVTANKALIATEGAALHAAAAEAGVDLSYEAAVAGAIPLLRPLRESLAGDRIRRVLGIVNGTTNYILTQMDATGASFDAALADAQALGYAEADPTADVDGHDAAAKAAILASLAFHTRVTLDDVAVQGIRTVSAEDVAAAREMGFDIKLLAVAELIEEPAGAGVSVRVHPTLVPRTHPLAGVRDAFNAVFVEAEAAGQVMFYGRGAGGRPTASAVLGDVVASARNRVTGSSEPGESSYAELPVLPIGSATTAYFVHLRVLDQPGVLAAVAGVFAEHGASIRSMTQKGEGEAAELLILTHPGREADLAATVEQLRRLGPVDAILGVMRVIGDGR
ncbi:MAG: homoserine dehydrogenase [Candidatus Nanopelagicales bacterium]|jgi:homoserine dehydrogenase|nr:homoserine dehydrogenase [Candidatus Nanopelagicales bacterium]